VSIRYVASHCHLGIIVPRLTIDRAIPTGPRSRASIEPLQVSTLSGFHRYRKEIVRDKRRKKNRALSRKWIIATPR